MSYCDFCGDECNVLLGVNLDPCPADGGYMFICEPCMQVLERGEPVAAGDSFGILDKDDDDD